MLPADTPDITENTATLLSTADGLFIPHGVISGYPAVNLFSDRWVFLVAEDNDSVGDRLTLDDLARLPWVTYLRTYDAPAVRQLSMIGIEPRVEVSAATFQALPFLVAGTRRVALIQESLAGCAGSPRCGSWIRRTTRCRCRRRCGGIRCTPTTPRTSGSAKPPPRSPRR